MTDQDRQRINTYLMEIAQGNFVALDGLSRLVSARMLSVALAIVKNRQSAEDIVQDSFVTILKRPRPSSLIPTVTAGYVRLFTTRQSTVCERSDGGVSTLTICSVCRMTTSVSNNWKTQLR